MGYFLKAIAIVLYTIFKFLLEVFCWGTFVVIVGYIWNNYVTSLFHVQRMQFESFLIWVALYFALKGLVDFFFLGAKKNE